MNLAMLWKSCRIPAPRAFFAPVHTQSVTVSAAPAAVTVSASPATVPVSVTVPAAPVTVTGSVSPAIVPAPAPATVTASSAFVTISDASQVSVIPSTAFSSREFPKFSGYQDTVDSKSRAYIRKCITKKGGNIRG